MKKFNIEIRPATKSDYTYFYGIPPAHTTVGYCVWLDEELVAIFGTLLNKMGENMLFSDMKPVDVPKITIYRWAKKCLDKIVSDKKSLFAMTEKSGKFLSSIGFRFYRDTKYGRLYEYIGWQ